MSERFEVPRDLLLGWGPGATVLAVDVPAIVRREVERALAHCIDQWHTGGWPTFFELRDRNRAYLASRFGETPEPCIHSGYVEGCAGCADGARQRGWPSPTPSAPAEPCQHDFSPNFCHKCGAPSKAPAKECPACGAFAIHGIDLIHREGCWAALSNGLRVAAARPEPKWHPEHPGPRCALCPPACTACRCPDCQNHREFIEKLAEWVEWEAPKPPVVEGSRYERMRIAARKVIG